FFASRRRHTRSKRDWSSDVCSSDLQSAPMPPLPLCGAAKLEERNRAMKKILLIGTGGTIASEMGESGLTPELTSQQLLRYIPDKIGRASCRERGWSRARRVR